jgi:pimeloyl-ACP methyl ester carboxylesterase
MRAPAPGAILPPVYTEHLHIPVGPGALHVERYGRGGPAIVLLHGFGTCAFLWRAVAPRLAEQGYTALAIDLLGFGESDRPPDGEFRPSVQAAYVEQAMSALGLGDVTVIGQDLGALVALLLAARSPTVVRRLALLEPLDPDDLPGPDIRALQRSSALTALQSHAMFAVRPLLEPLLRGAVTAPEQMPDLLVARYLAPFVGSAGATDLLRLASAITLSADDWQRLAMLRADVLLWCGVGQPVQAPGKSSRGGDPAGRVSRWQQLLPAATLRPVTTGVRADTLVAEHAPAALTAALRAWVAYTGHGR